MPLNSTWMHARGYSMGRWWNSRQESSCRLEWCVPERSQTRSSTTASSHEKCWNFLQQGSYRLARWAAPAQSRLLRLVQGSPCQFPNWVAEASLPQSSSSMAPAPAPVGLRNLLQDGSCQLPVSAVEVSRTQCLTIAPPEHARHSRAGPPAAEVGGSSSGCLLLWEGNVRIQALRGSDCARVLKDSWTARPRAAAWSASSTRKEVWASCSVEPLENRCARYRPLCPGFRRRRPARRRALATPTARPGRSGARALHRA
mmetsp:Transcript_34961/g.111117  ORF Transcript_34961/g.111117 Transcript_34961/m.111117 type:complete len:257 (+) Transcript_34961:716-1486(+)